MGIVPFSDAGFSRRSPVRAGDVHPDRRFVTEFVNLPVFAFLWREARWAHRSQSLFHNG